MARITIPVKVDTGGLLTVFSNELSSEAILKFVKDLDRMVADWGFTKKLYTYFRAEMNVLESEEKGVLSTSGPWLDAEIYRLWQNSPELHADVKSFAAFQRVVKAIERAHGIRND